MVSLLQMSRMNITNHSWTCPPEYSFTGDRAFSARVLVGINVFFCFIGIVLNVMAGVAVFSTRGLNLSYHYFLSSLTVAELIVSVVCQPLLIALILAQLNLTCIPALQLTFRLITNLALYASVGTVTLIGLDRCLYICGQFDYSNTMTSRKKMTLVLVWVMAGVMCGFITFVPEYMTFSWVVISFLFYATVYYQISLQKNNRSRSSHENPADQRNKAQSGNETPRWQVACAVISILLLISLRYFPPFLFIVLNLGKRFGLLYYTMISMTLIPSALYPVAYCLCYHNYRRSLKRVCSRFNPFAMKHRNDTENTSKEHVRQELQSSIKSTTV